MTLTPCIEWDGYCDPEGRGRRWWNGKVESAPRAAWEEGNGPILEGLCVLHRCDNPRCVNPDHLFLGTQAENMQDCRDKGRVAGMRLTREIVEKIRAGLDAGARVCDVARYLGVSYMCIAHIKHRRTWA